MSCKKATNAVNDQHVLALLSWDFILPFCGNCMPKVIGAVSVCTLSQNHIISILFAWCLGLMSLPSFKVH